MSEEAVEAPTEGADPSAAADGGSTNTSTSTQDDLGAGLAAAMGGGDDTAGISSRLEKMERMIEDRNRTISRQGEELGSLRKMTEQKQPEKVDTSVDRLFTDPQGFLREYRQQILDDVRAEVGQKMEPVDRMNAAAALQQNNPLAAAMLNNPAIAGELRSLIQDPETLASISNGPSASLSAALFHLAGSKWGKQTAARRTAPPPARPEAAGAASPPANPAAKAPTTKAAPLPKSMDEAVRMYSEAVAKGA
jgi:hypothetical protein